MNARLSVVVIACVVLIGMASASLCAAQENGKPLFGAGGGARKDDPARPKNPVRAEKAHPQADLIQALQALEQAQRQHCVRLTELLETVPENARPAIQRALAASQKGLENARAQLDRVHGGNGANEARGPKLGHAANPGANAGRGNRPEGIPENIAAGERPNRGGNRDRGIPNNLGPGRPNLPNAGGQAGGGRRPFGVGPQGGGRPGGARGR